jgi:hypothetical protein
MAMSLVAVARGEAGNCEDELADAQIRSGGEQLRHRHGWDHHHSRPPENGTVFSNPVFSSGKTPITHCGDEPKYETIAAIDQPGVRIIVNPGGTNERFDRAHLQKATIVPWSDNASIYDALVEGKADLMITDAVETRVQAKLHPGVLRTVHPNAVRPFGTRLLDAARSDLRGLRQSMAEPARSLGRASGDPRPMDALSAFHSYDRLQKGAQAAPLPRASTDQFSAVRRQPPLFDCNNPDFAAVHLHGLTDPLSNEQPIATTLEELQTNVTGMWRANDRVCRKRFSRRPSYCLAERPTLITPLRQPGRELLISRRIRN